MTRIRLLPGLVLLVLGAWAAPAHAYIGGPPATLGMMCYWSTHVIQVRVEKVDKEKGVIVWRKLSDYKGKWPGGDVIRQTVANLPDRAYILQWADVGKTTAMFALESYKWSHTYIDNFWYACNTGDWQSWNGSHFEPIVLRTYCGRAEKLQAAAGAILAGKEVIVPCMMDGNPQELAQRKAKVQRLRASLKLLDYNAKRDFVSWGGDDFDPLPGMPGFSHICPLPRVGPDAQAISLADFDGDGKANVCLIGANRLAVLQNSGDSLMEMGIPGLSGGCRAAVWADYNGDGLPDLLLATANGPRLYTNLGKGAFRDDSHLLPREEAYDLTCAAWIDQDGDGKPDILLGNGFHGLRLYRNKGKADPMPPPQPGKITLSTAAQQWFEDVSAAIGFGPEGIGSSVKGDTLTVCDVDGDGRPDILYGAGNGLLLLNTPKGFVEAKDSGISYKAGKVGPVFGDFDGDGQPDLFIPQPGGCKLFRNDGKGHFTDVTDKSGALAKFQGNAACAAWGDVDNDGHLDLMVGCLKEPNRFFRNKGDGTFVDATEEIGLHKRIFNTQAIALVDLNRDGVLDVVFNNEGQNSVALLGDKTQKSSRTPVTLGVTGKSGVIGSRVRVLDSTGKSVAMQDVGGGDGRGGQTAAQVHFALAPGTYRVEVRTSSGLTRTKDVIVDRTPVWGMLTDQ